MLKRCIGKHKKRTLFYAYQGIVEESQFKKLQSQIKSNKQIPSIENIRPYSILNILGFGKRSKVEEQKENEKVIIDASSQFS